ncbi:LamG-like jellyroll fold domain-containing protein [Pedobacter frigiditerrae]|uniref:LamG-like jellyroll fold domain-containing protein n=1 Tax=Pedobacter frigiditerrae TaxID=2530452 RepID=UPI00292CA8A1|nr:LamG-like jellyroll fold domain-containing protein [Pedobacter frigiditerrae]
MKLHLNIKQILPLVAFVAIIYSGCKKYDNPPPFFEDPITRSVVQRKVIVISIDGLTGSELKTIAPPTIDGLRKTSKYTYDVLRGAVANDVASWASMLNGVSYAKHLIQSDDFLPTPKPNSHETPAVFRNTFDYILQYKSLKTAIVTPWPNLRNYLRIADFAPVVSTDVAVKDSVINILNTQSQIGALVANFRDVQAAGGNGGYVATNANYKNAVLKADEYVGNIVTAIKARKTYANEDWLIILTTNHGGSSNDPKAGFLIASNKSLKEEELKKSGFNTILFKGSSVIAQVMNDNGLYDPGETKDFTVQMQVKFNVQTSYPGFLSKGTPMLGSAITGWMFRQGGAGVSAAVGGTLNGGTGKVEYNTGNAADLSWHTITMTVKMDNATTRTLTTYLDGVQVTTANILSRKSLSSSEKLTIGYKNVDNGGTSLSFQAADLCYFNTALDAATILANKGLKDITQHPKYANLTGYWPIDEGAEGILNNKAPGGYNMELSGAYTWVAMGKDVPTSVNPDPNAGGKSILLTSASVSASMLYWLNIKILPEFGMDGNPFLNQFEIEFLK